MNDTLKKILRYILFTLIALALLFLAFRGTNFDEIVEHLKSANYYWVILSIVMGYAAVLSRGYRWLLLLRPLGYKPRLWSSIHSVSFGYMFNIFVPRAGEIGRCGVMSKAEDIPVDKLFGTVILERLIDFIFLIFIIGLAFILNIQDFFSLLDTNIDVEDLAVEKSNFNQKLDLVLYWVKQVIIAIIVLGGTAFAVILLFFRQKLINHPKFVPVRTFWNGLKEGFKSIQKIEKKWAFIGHSLFIWIIYFLMVYVCFFSIQETSHLTISNGFFIMMAASLGIVIPAPGGIGSYHYLVTLAMVVVGVDKSIGLSFATIVHTSQTIMLLSAGIIGLIYFSLAKNKRAKDAQQSS